MTTIKHTIASIACLLVLAVPIIGNANDFVDNVKNDTKALTDVPSRVLGTPGHNVAKEAIVKRIESLSGVSLVRQPFDVMMPVTKKAVMTVAEGEFKGDHTIHPVWPDNVRLNTTSAEGITGPVVYIGEGFYESMPAKSFGKMASSLQFWGKSRAFAGFRRRYRCTSQAASILQTSFLCPRWRLGKCLQRRKSNQRNPDICWELAARNR